MKKCTYCKMSKDLSEFGDRKRNNKIYKSIYCHLWKQGKILVIAPAEKDTKRDNIVIFIYNSEYDNF